MGKNAFPFRLTKPCKDCPFRTDKAGYLHSARAREIAESVLGGSNFHCHKTIEHDEEGETCVNPSKSEMCAGAMLFAEKVLDGRNGGAGCGVNQMARIGMRLGTFNPDLLDATAPVHESVEAMVRHHAREDT